MKLSKPALLVFLMGAETAAEQTLSSREPARLDDLPNHANDSLPTIFGSNGTITVKGTTADPGVVVLDYGANVEGLPTFQVLSATGDTSRLEITYSESRPVLDNYYMVSGSLQVCLEAILIFTTERRTTRFSRCYGHLQTQPIQYYWTLGTNK